MRKKLWLTILSMTCMSLLTCIAFLLWFIQNSNTPISINLIQGNVTNPIKSNTNTIKSDKKDISTSTNQNIKKPTFPDKNETIAFSNNGWDTVNNSDSLLVLVNKHRKLIDNYIPPQLIVPNVRFTFDEMDEKRKLRAVAALSLEELFETAKRGNIHLYAVSGYRSYKRQKSVYNTHITKLGEKKAKEVSAYPGSSEHQTGLSIDITAKSVQYQLTTKFSDTIEGKWLANNAHRFGFIVRYPKDKVLITDYSYEPWHLRYVGAEYSKFLYDNHLTLEEAYTKK